MTEVVETFDTKNEANVILFDDLNNGSLAIQDWEELQKAVRYILSVYQKQNIEPDLALIQKTKSICQVVLYELRTGTTAAIASLLYHAYDRFELSLVDIEKDWDKDIVSIIQGIKKISSEFDIEKMSKQSENFVQLILTLAQDVRSVLVRLAQRLHEIRTLENLDDKKQKQVRTEIQNLYTPIAHRLGLYQVKNEMEEITMRLNHPEMYQHIQQKLNESQEERDTYIGSFVGPLKKTFSAQGFVCEIKGRPKSIHSIFKKMQAQKVPFEEVYDIFAIRIILDNNFKDLKEEKSECWNAYSLITDIYTPNPKRLRDWISSPKSSSYESLHTTVLGPDRKWVEVQIRTRRMDDIAEKGVAAHWKYKDKSAGKTGAMDEWLQNVRLMLEKQNNNNSGGGNQAKIDLYSHEVFVFTPNGDLRKITNGATVLDFAFEIHSDLGMQCTGAIVNGKSAPLNLVIKNGDSVKIQTSKQQKPKREWLDFVATSKANERIKRYLREQEYKNLDVGKELIKTKIIQLGKNFKELYIHMLVEYFKCENSIALYEKAGTEGFDTSEVKTALGKQILLYNFGKPLQEADISKLVRNLGFKSEVEMYQANCTKELDINKIRTILSSDDRTVPELSVEQMIDELTKDDKPTQNIKGNGNLIIDDKLGQIDFEFAKCCNPVLGDRIFGFVTASKGTKIHKVTCTNAKDLVSNYPYRIVKAKWVGNESRKSFLAKLHVEGSDKVGILKSITKTLNDINIQSINLNSNSKIFKGSISVFVSDTAHLDFVIGKINAVEGVTKVERS